MRKDMTTNFTLTKDEVQVRVLSATDKFINLALFCDRYTYIRALDTIFPCGWEPDYEVKDGAIYCRITHWDENGNSKTGCEIGETSKDKNGNDKIDKTSATDAFKRAAGLYTVSSTINSIDSIVTTVGKIIKKGSYNGKDQYTCYDKFIVSKFEVDDNQKIKELAIYNCSEKKNAYHYKEGKYNMNGILSNVS